MYTEKQFEEKYQKYNQMVYNICFSYLKNIDNTNDALQEIFIRIYHLSKNLNDNEERYYIVRISINVCKDFLRKTKRKQSHETTEIDVDQIGYSQTEDIDIFEYVRRLPQPYREVIILYYANSMTYQDISKSIGISESNVRKRHERAIKKLRKIMEESDNDVRNETQTNAIGGSENT